MGKRLVELRITAGHPWHSSVGPGPDRIISLAVLGATDAAHEVIGHLRHWHPLRQVETASIEVEMPSRSTRAAVHLEQLPVSDQVADRERLNAKRLACGGYGLGSDRAPV